MSAKTAKKRKHYLSEAEKRDVARRYHAGEAAADLALEFDISESSVHSHARAFPSTAEEPADRDRLLMEFGAAIERARAIGGPLGLQVNVTKLLAAPPAR